MKILLSTDKLARGGKEKQILLLANGLLENGHEINILSKDKIDLNNYYEEIGFPQSFISTFGKGSKYSMRSRYTRMTLEFQPDVILNFDVKSSLWTQRFNSNKLRNIPAVNCTIRRATPYNSFKSRILAKMCLRRSKYIVSNSKVGLELYNIQKSQTHTVIYNGIDLDRYKNAKAIPEAEIYDQELPSNAIKIVTVGSLFSHKGQHTLIEAIKMLSEKNIYTTIIGEGPERYRLQEKIDELELGNRVKLLGRKSNVERYLKSADLYVNPSWGEGCSNALLEAMACNLPVITTEDGGTPEIVHNNSTHFFEKNDAHGLSIAINKMSSSDSYNLNDLNEWITQFDHLKMVDQYEALLTKVVFGDC